MTETEELERRISAALARISYGIEARGAPVVPVAPAAAVDDGEIERLKSALESAERERDEIQEDFAATRARMRAKMRGLEDELADKGEALKRLDSKLQQLKSANAALMDTSAALRNVAETGLDAGVVDAAMKAELDALKTARAAETSEMDAILSALTPVLSNSDQEDA